ncbi:PREDICTED: uncharacterized protein LOC109173580 isoform X2 [Ipomoea nil]|uniref:uncharacterized protein LOC109173580 isoform X1 n=1 Tax=Ipomoea nil TaxID=35883 RepID=UPI000901E03D|nr:PREDICTED: uncharacterized protein LOC109173580 isoform X1 [Ipomoea nil]XP_019178369.1 PREDICTED: uncharacterized protein LOC109173580 isoform X2 [Ipomoea nil]XP_019178370.1 PREDICTED: uncharacterized protein LOC109173580 isoform X2 [Ipomoea nil]XP_019178371.1 PREDICTED: uncharacterized protein LOC109173580 isoform X2 [Ipomoea nil]
MSCLNLKGLFPTTKVLKLLSSKLHRLSRSKVIKKQQRKTPLGGDKAAIIKKGGSGRWPKLTGRGKKKKFQFKTTKRIDFHKKPAPVYIDQLFVEPVKEHPEIPDAKLKKDDCDHRLDDDHEACSSTAVDGGGGSGEADDMWEAIVLASPEMHGINERAEEFISNFRAEMKRQETLDTKRRL